MNGIHCERETETETETESADNKTQFKIMALYTYNVLKD